jgi:hypothetical protein
MEIETWKLTLGQNVSTFFHRDYHSSPCFVGLNYFETCNKFTKRKFTLFSFVPNVTLITTAF